MTPYNVSGLDRSEPIISREGPNKAETLYCVECCRMYANSNGT